jgi:hypothetical protein
MPASHVPIRAMTRLLAEMQTNIMACALPLFDGRVDRFMIFSLLNRRQADGGRPLPVLAAAESLGLPFETTRRHIAEMIDIGLCRRDRGGIMSQVSFDDESWSALFIEAHDSLVRFVEDMRAIDALPCFPSSARSYDWNHGLAATADLMLAVADGNQGTHHDRLDLVVFSTVMAASQRRVTIDLALSRQHRMIAAPPPSHLVRPVRARRVADALGLSEATVRRRVDRLIEGPLEVVDGGLIPRETWISSAPAQLVSLNSYLNISRLMRGLAAHGFSFEQPSAAYRGGRPAYVRFD